ncbi:MAG TPA: MDR family MFS transporter [Solirubrobacteraceae bacterium]|nr:MDR family MFS transporter [Solirubrobacteraceae bacterium]
MTTVTATAPVSGQLARSRVRVIFGALMLVLLLAALDQTIVATALPTIVGDLGGLSHLSWVTSAFLLAQTAVTPLYGKLGDLYGRKRILQSAVVLFLIGSVLCGQSNSMTELIAFRAVQGLGAGGLIVLIQAVVGDVVPPRERGRYQGLFGAVFGVASVAGPLLGGVIVDSFSWRWIFYVNVPIGIVALVVLGATLPATKGQAKPVIDYLGAGILASALSAIVLVASLGGTSWAWGSSETILVGAAGLVLLGVFTIIERRAVEPILPPELLRNRVFSVGSTLSLIVGFAMFGSITFLPLYFQTVDAATPTGGGLRLIPMMLGLLTMSIVSGQLIARRGRYRVFPILGTALMTIGLFLLSHLDVGTSTITSSLYLLILGLGLGSTMQVLVLAVQNAVHYRVLGAATSGVTLFRGIGGSLGAAVFGAIFSARLASQLKHLLTGSLAGQVSGGGRLTGSQVARLPAGARAIYEHAYVHALQPVFLAAAGVALVAFALAWLMPERPLRETAATSRGLDDGLAAPRAPDSLAEIERALSLAVSPEQRDQFRERLALRTGVDLTPGAAWALVRIGEYGLSEARKRAGQDGVPPERVAAVVTELRGKGLVAGEDGGAALTESGRRCVERAITARRELLTETLADHAADRDPAIDRLLHRLARELAGEPPRVAA